MRLLTVTRPPTSPDAGIKWQMQTLTLGQNALSRLLIHDLNTTTKKKGSNSDVCFQKTRKPYTKSNTTELLTRVYTTAAFFPRDQSPTAAAFYLSMLNTAFHPSWWSQLHHALRMNVLHKILTSTTYKALSLSFRNWIYKAFFFFFFFPKYFHRQRIKKDFNYTHMVTTLP